MRTGNIIFSACASVLFFGSLIVRPQNLAGTKPLVANPQFFPSYSPYFPAPVGTRNAFVLSQNYPISFASNEAHPWTRIDFQHNPKGYLSAVLEYCLEGNEEIDFVVQKNTKRKWFHAPWLHDDGKFVEIAPGVLKQPLEYIGNGREYIHGLTRERQSEPYELHSSQDKKIENWAIGFYNEPGGYTLGKVWRSSTYPNPSLATFPEGTVSFKLLFTAGTVAEVPFLRGTKEWIANIYPCNPKDNQCINSRTRQNKVVRLLQIDVAVKDRRAGPTGWVFGTFIYNGAGPSGSPLHRMVPVGLSWGDDSNVTAMLNKEGVFKNPALRQSIVNDELLPSNLTSINKAYMLHHGLGGRLNGPVDNPVSSCISCHARAGIDNMGNPLPMGNFTLTRAKYDITNFRRFFSTIPGGARVVRFDNNNYVTTDYSLQTAAGVRNFWALIKLHQAMVSNKSRISNKSTMLFKTAQLPREITRGEK